MLDGDGRLVIVIVEATTRSFGHFETSVLAAPNASVPKGWRRRGGRSACSSGNLLRSGAGRSSTIDHDCNRRRSVSESDYRRHSPFALAQNGAGRVPPAHAVHAGAGRRRL